MADGSTLPPITFWDIASDTPRTWSPNTYKVALALAHRRLPHERIFLSYPDIAPTLSALGVAPHTGEDLSQGIEYTCPSLRIGPAGPDNPPLMGSDPILDALDALAPASPAHPALFPTPAARELKEALAAELQAAFGSTGSWMYPVAGTAGRLDPRGAEYFRRTRAEWFGMSVEEKEAELGDGYDKALVDTFTPIARFVKRTQAAAAAPSGEEGPFLTGSQPIYPDLYLVGIVQWFAFTKGPEEIRRVLQQVEGGVLGRLVEAAQPLVDQT